MTGVLYHRDGTVRCGKCRNVVERVGTVYVCQHCRQQPAGTAKPGLGDMVAAGLDAVGITKQRVQAVASRVGIKDCGCKRRQQAMNSWGNKVLGLPKGQTPPAS